MRLAVIVPGDDFDETRSELEEVVPAIEPEEIRREYPVLAVGDFIAEMCKEPTGCSYVCQYAGSISPLY